MIWIRVRCKRAASLKFPELCPNCLAHEALTNVRIRKTIWLGTGSLTYSINWPFCEKFARLYRQRQVFVVLTGVIPAIVCAAIAVYLTIRAPTEASNLGLQLLALSVIFLLISFSISRIYPRLQKVDDGRISNLETIRIIRAGTDVISGEPFFDLRFQNLEYVKALIKINPGILDINQKYLDKAIAKLRNSSTNQS